MAIAIFITVVVNQHAVSSGSIGWRHCRNTVSMHKKLYVVWYLSMYGLYIYTHLLNDNVLLTLNWIKFDLEMRWQQY